MGKTEKGKKGFQPTPKEQQRTKKLQIQLTPEEYDSLRSQFVISKGKGGRRYLPYAFTEQGVAMLSFLF